MSIEAVAGGALTVMIEPDVHQIDLDGQYTPILEYGPSSRTFKGPLTLGTEQAAQRAYDVARVASGHDKSIQEILVLIPRVDQEERVPAGLPDGLLEEAIAVLGLELYTQTFEFTVFQGNVRLIRVYRADDSRENPWLA